VTCRNCNLDRFLTVKGKCGDKRDVPDSFTLLEPKVKLVNAPSVPTLFTFYFYVLSLEYPQALSSSI
jgi:hypothetical protein